MRTLWLLFKRQLVKLREQVRRWRAPALPGLLAALLLAMVIPFALSADNTEPRYSLSLARARLDRFEAKGLPLCPKGEVLCTRPVFSWAGKSRALSYEFQVLEVLPDGTTQTTIGPVGVLGTSWQLQPPGRLDRGKSYRFTVQAVGKGARPVGTRQEVDFKIVSAHDKLLEEIAGAESIRDDARRNLVLAGLYVQYGRMSDVAAALEAYAKETPEGEDSARVSALLAKMDRR